MKIEKFCATADATAEGENELKTLLGLGAPSSRLITTPATANPTRTSDRKTVPTPITSPRASAPPPKHPQLIPNPRYHAEVMRR